MHTADESLLEKCVKFASFGVFLFVLLVHSKCKGMMHHSHSQVSTKKSDLAIFWRDRQYFLLDYQAKSWIVGRYVFLCTSL